MKLTLCGTSAGPFTAKRACSGYILEDEGHVVMLECGPGSVRNALAAGVTLRDIEAVVISHIHEDHSLDLGALTLQAMYGRWQRMPVVYGPPGIKDVATRLMSMHRPNAVVPPLEIVEIGDSDEREVGGFVMQSEETKHAADIRAFSRRFTSNGRSLVFSGDTRPNPEVMVPLAKGADLLLHEAFSLPGLDRYASGGSEERYHRIMTHLPTIHSDVREVASIANDAGAERLILTHILPTEDDELMEKEAAAIYKGDLAVGRDGLSIEI
jgi:ribonuclease BN (tRNA processing enzyme)